jgi:hypothetical protein
MKEYVSLLIKSEKYINIQMSVLHILVMLSDLILEHNGKVTNNRISDVNAQKQEVTVIGKGKMRGLEISLIITYWNMPIQVFTENKSQLTHYYGEGNGIISSMHDAKETATVTEYGIGRLIGQKSVWRGSAFYMTSSCGKFAVLNNTVGVFETDVDNVLLDVNQKVWEWK